MKAVVLAVLLFAGGIAVPVAAPGPVVTHAATLILGFSDGTCSGTAVGPNLVLTAEHCIVEGPLVKINGQPASIVGTAVVDGNDHALIKVSVRFKRWARIGGSMYQGQPLRFWGNPGGMSNIFRRGYVAGTHQGWYLLDMMGWRGDSGSGLFDRRGRIVSVISTLYVNDAFHMMGAKPLGYTRKQYASVGL